MGSFSCQKKLFNLYVKEGKVIRRQRQQKPISHRIICSKRHFNVKLQVHLASSKLIMKAFGKLYKEGEGCTFWKFFPQTRAWNYRYRALAKRPKPSSSSSFHKSILFPWRHPPPSLLSFEPDRTNPPFPTQNNSPPSIRGRRPKCSPGGKKFVQQGGGGRRLWKLLQGEVKNMQKKGKSKIFRIFYDL